MAELKKQRFQTQIYKALLDKKKALKNITEDSQKVIEDFKNDYFEKLSPYIEIYQELENDKFEKDVENNENDQEDSMEESSIFQKTNRDNKLSGKNGMKEGFLKILNEFDQMTSLPLSQTPSFANPSEAINYYADIWETKY